MDRCDAEISIMQLEEVRDSIAVINRADIGDILYTDDVKETIISSLLLSLDLHLSELNHYISCDVQ